MNAALSRVSLSLWALALPSLARAADQRIVGSWKTEDGSSLVAIEPCGPSFCGKIAWLREPDDKNGIAWTDTKNPEPPLRSRPILGLRILTGLRSEDPGAWTSGRIYDPNSGSTYSCKATLEGRDRLILRGYLVNPLFGRSETWTRAIP